MVAVCSEWSLAVAREPSLALSLCSFPVAEQILDSISSKAWSLFLIIADKKAQKSKKKKQKEKKKKKQTDRE